MQRAKEICMLLIALCGAPVFSAPHGNPQHCPEILEYIAGKLLEDFKEKTNRTEFQMEEMRAKISASFTGLPDCTFPQGTNATTIFRVLSAFNELFLQMNSLHPEHFFPMVVQEQTLWLCGLSKAGTSASPTPITYKKPENKFEQDMQLYYAFDYHERCMKTLAKRWQDCSQALS